MSERLFRTPIAAAVHVSRPRLLLAEDDDELRAVLSSIFESDGFEVTCARTGLELMQLLEDARICGRFPDLVVTDHRMPGVTGLDITRAVRDNDWPVPIIIITAHSRDLDDAAEVGADAVFEKPFDADDLRTAVLYCIESGRDRSGAHVEDHG